ncbi:hypothetical protein PAXRUDRAFT_28386 [Paxillus rubicundulus Ve08.2h10]|uniref:Uncharacterized protein n=1 Tax=Paxillus rubicundulus Ve08.2h10 TaxID=930991 RepID=A0A0D0DMB1_9AGAM|nr:hypothetical protein PAXRUDRAFT_28386 [Paxillus rubicundulus Ve08.2h10]
MVHTTPATSLKDLAGIIVEMHENQNNHHQDVDTQLTTLKRGQTSQSPICGHSDTCTGRGLYEEDAEDVTESHNKLLMVGREARTALKNITQSKCLHDRKIKWNKLSLFEFAKEMCQGFKPKWKADNDPHKMAEKVDHQYCNRWLQCRKDKAQQLMTVSLGPENNEMEAAKLAWKQHMTAHKHMPNSEGALENISFLEVLQSPWRSKEWLEVNKDKSKLEDLLKEWGKWEDPKGFGSKKHLEDQGSANLGPIDEGKC